MRTRTLKQMLSEYGTEELEIDDNNNREEMLLTFPYPVIIEGAFMEFDSLNKWITENFGLKEIQWLVYGKTEYDFGFAEYFFNNELQAKAVAEIATYIYTIYPYSSKPNHIDKSNGYNEFIDYDPADENAIVVRL